MIGKNPFDLYVFIGNIFFCIPKKIEAVNGLDFRLRQKNSNLHGSLTYPRQFAIQKHTILLHFKITCSSKDSGNLVAQRSLSRFLKKY